MSFVYTSGLIIISDYFKRRIALAMGIASLGTALGSFAFPPLVQQLFYRYGYQGAFIIMSAIVSHIFIGASLFRTHPSKARTVNDFERSCETEPGSRERNDVSHTDHADTKESKLEKELMTSNTGNIDNGRPKGGIESEGSNHDNNGKVTERVVNFMKPLWKKAGFGLLKDMDFLSLIFLSFNINFILTAVIGYFPALAVDKGISPLDAGKR